MGPMFRRRPFDACSITVIDLPDRHLASYLVCLEDWSAEMDEAGDHKARWYEMARDAGLRVKLAVDEADQPVGMIQYVPVELSPIDGENLMMILCIWVHGYRKGVGDVQGSGIGTSLLEAAEDDARALGAEGMAAWGLRLPVWMKASWFQKHGYRRVDRAGVRDLMWKPFVPGAVAPHWIAATPVEIPVAIGAAPPVHVTAYLSGWCPATNLIYERARRAADELGPEVRFTTIDTSDRDTMLRCGRSDEVLVNGTPLQRGAPPPYRVVRREIVRQLRRQRSRRSALRQ